MSDEKQTGAPHKAGAFDIRNIIGALMGLYGVILTLAGIFADPELEKTGGVNANLWTGLALIAVAAVFFGWARFLKVHRGQATLAEQALLKSWERVGDGGRP